MARLAPINATTRRLFLLLLVLIAYAWRVSSLDGQSLWRDEVDAIYFAVRALPETISMFVQAAQNGPLYFLALRPWFLLAGTTEFVLRYPSVMTGTLSIPLLWQVARRLVPDNVAAPLSAALLGTLFMTFNSYQVWYGQEGKMYATITFLTLLATWCWLRGMESGGWRWWLGYWATVSIAMYTHLLMVLIIPLHLLWYLIAWPVSRKHWRGYGLAVAGLTLPYLPMVWWQWEFLTAPDKRTGFTYKPFVEILRMVYLSQVRGFSSSVDLIWLAPAFFLLGAGILLGFTVIRKSQSGSDFCLSPLRRYGLLLAWLVLPVLSIYLVSIRQPVFTERYVIWIGPAVALFMALGLRVLVLNGGRLGALIAVVFLTYLLFIWSFESWQQKTLTIKYDLRSAVQYISSRRTLDQALLLQIPHQEWSYRYYTSDFGRNPFDGSDTRLGYWLQGPYTNYGENDPEARKAVDDYLRSYTQNVDEVWVMLSEAEMWDARRLTDEWLETNGTREEAVDFPGVQVRRYRLDDGEQ